MKPLEPGCLAITINSNNGNNGICVKILEYVGEVNPTWIYKNYWRVDRKIQSYSVITNKKSKITDLIDEHQLLRIDGYNIQFEECNKELIQEGLNE